MLFGLAKAGAKLGLAAVFAGAAASAAGLAVAMKGVKKALDLGGDLSDLSSRTGIAVKELVVLQQAFEDNGLAASKVGPIINKMQKSISDASNGLSTQVRALDAMGVSMEDLKDKSPMEQFRMLQKGLSDMENVTLRAGAAMDIFGRSGGELQALFDDGAALDKAKTTIGGQAEILDRNAATFDRASDLMKSAGKKLQGMFVGMAEFINPVLLPMLEKFDKLDLSKYGQAAGRFVSVVAAAFSSDKLPSLMKDGLVWAGKTFINLLVRHIRGLIAYVVEGFKSLPNILISGFRVITKPEFWNGLKGTLMGLGSVLGVAFLKLIPPKLLSAAGVSREGLDIEGRWGSARMQSGLKRAGQALEPLTDSMGNAVKDGFKAYLHEVKNSNIMDTSGERDRMSKAIQSFKDMAAARQDEAEAAREEKEAPAFRGEQQVKSGVLGNLKPIISSLAAQGGAAGLLGIGKGMDQERNNLLKEIARNTRAGGAAPGPARFA